MGRSRLRGLVGRHVDRSRLRGLQVLAGLHVVRGLLLDLVGLHGDQGRLADIAGTLKGRSRQLA